jgi:beta-glucanase (GH16 family)
VLNIFKYRLLYFFLILAVLPGCREEEPPAGDPANLTVDIIISEDVEGMVQVLAKADNAVRYELYVDSSMDPEFSNESGVFEYTFTVTGNHSLEIRAYGSTGRFVKETRQVLIDLRIEVSIEDGYISPESYNGYEMVWNDEFEGSQLNSSFWGYDLGDGCPNCGWGNNELQYYRKENAWVKDGTLWIEARKESFAGKTYTSSRVKTQGFKSFVYGRIDIRALLPQGQGMWPALWMLGDSFTTEGWPACGEIDIMEMIGGGGRENTTYGTLHWDFDGDRASSGGSYTLPSGTLADEYHVFSIIWDESEIKWLLNNVEYYKLDITAGHMSEFHNKFFFIFNLAVGGNWPGAPNTTTIFPQTMKVDYVRVFQRN